jgi:ABC-2 type transport system permease protein
MTTPVDTIAPREPGPTERGTIYDIGYRRYDGPRLGRLYAARSLYGSSLRAAFGLGRSTRAKLAPLIISALLLMPAIAQIGIASASNGQFKVSAFDYMGSSMLLIVLFCAAQAPEIMSADQRNHVLPLYFSRAIERDDYALSKLAAFATALFALLIVPQLLLFVSRTAIGTDMAGEMQKAFPDLLPLLGATMLTAIVTAAISLAIAAYTPRRAYATAGVVGYFILTTALQQALRSGGEDSSPWLTLLSPIALVNALCAWLFRAEPRAARFVESSSFSAVLFTDAVIVYVVLALALLLMRVRRVRT